MCICLFSKQKQRKTDMKKQIHSLTGLKALFIMLIVMDHTLPDTPLIQSIPLAPLLSSYGGSWGNAMFFMLSGYLLSMGYSERIRTRSISFKDYLCRRLAKLYPMYLLSNLVMMPLSVNKYGISVLNLRRIASVLLLQAGGALENAFPYNGSAWFVCALFTCYILYFIVAYHSSNQTQYYSFLVAGIILGYFLSVRYLDVPYCYNENGVAYVNFFTGCILSEIIPKIPEKVHGKLSLLFFGSLCCIAYMMLKIGVDQAMGGGVTGYSFIMLPMIVFLATVPNIISRILGSKPLVYLGKISIATYFWHGVLQEILLQITGTAEFTDKVFFLYMILLFPVCIGIYQLFRLKKAV